MKKLLITLVFSIAFSSIILAQPNYEVRIVKSAIDYLEVQIRQTVPGQSPTTSSSCTDISFSVRWSNTVDVTFDYDAVLFNVACVINPNLKIVANRLNFGGYYYYKFYTESVFNFPTTWSDNVWQKICRIKINSVGTGTATFEIGPDEWVGVGTGTELNIGVNLVDYAMTLVAPAATEVPYPTQAFDYVWRGGQSDDYHDGNSWDLGSNWMSVCDVPLSSPPNNTYDVIVPVVASNMYPENVKTLFEGTETQPFAQDVVVKSGAHIRVQTSEVLDDYSYANFFWLYTFSTLTVENGGHVFISPGGRLTVNGTGLGSVKLYGPDAIVLESGTITVDPAGENGGPFERISQASLLEQANTVNIQYFNNATVKAQTYITHPTGGTDPFYVHMVGPRLDVTGTSYTGAPLSAFNMTSLQTFAYYYKETTNSWVNIFQNTTAVPSVKGLILSNSVANDDMFEMSGQVIETDYDTTGLTITTGQGLGWHMFNNPFAASLDLNTFRSGDNSTRIGTNYQIWNPSVGAYGVYNTTSSSGTNGTSRYVQPGQAFFAQALVAGTYARFNDQRRVHQNTEFLKSGEAYTLRVKATGFSYYSDESIIRFAPEGVSNFDAENDAEKWQSMMENATEIWTTSGDMYPLAINTLPSLGAAMVSVPLSFECHEATTYQLKFTQIESFDPGTTIYLEDLLTGGEWHNLVDNPVYSFTGNPEDSQSRFILHFFGPTGIDDPSQDASMITIYSYNHDAYIVNHGTEVIEKYVVYDMMGRELQSGTLPVSTVNKVFIGNVSGYYVVKVITSNRIYSEKIYINR